MNPQTVIDTALAANATTLGSAEAATIFREQFKSMPKVSVNLTPGQRQLLEKSINFPVVFTGGKNVTNDHPVLVAYRDLCRTIYSKEHKVMEAKERCLVVGASMREITTYSSNPHIHYYVHGKENKDYDRVVRPALMHISEMLRKKANKSNKKIFLPPQHSDEATFG